MVYNAVIGDGTNVMTIRFADETTAMYWIDLQMDIKHNADTLFEYVVASGHRYNHMTAEHKAYGERWLQKIRNLRAMGYGVPPSIDASRQEYEAFKRGELN